MLYFIFKYIKYNVVSVVNKCRKIKFYECFIYILNNKNIDLYFKKNVNKYK